MTALDAQLISNNAAMATLQFLLKIDIIYYLCHAIINCQWHISLNVFSIILTNVSSAILTNGLFPSRIIIFFFFFYFDINDYGILNLWCMHVPVSLLQFCSFPKRKALNYTRLLLNDLTSFDQSDIIFITFRIIGCLTLSTFF